MEKKHTKIEKNVSHASKPKNAEVSKKDKYIETVGRRKTSVARVRLYLDKEKKKDLYDVLINEKPFSKYFPLKVESHMVVSPFMVTGENHRVTVHVSGGGLKSQAESVRLGISRLLVQLNSGLRPKLKSLGYLKRDPRMVERKKFGSRKARRPQQWRKR